MRERPWLCLVTDRRRVSPDARTTRDEIAALERVLDDAIDAGIDLIQLRERDLEAATLKTLASAVVARTRGSQTMVVVNERADVAHAASAAGVHCRSESAPVARVRPLGPAGWIVGRSVHSAEEAARAATADYFIFGTVFSTTSKPASAPVHGLAGLHAAVKSTRVPVLAIGGITIERAIECLAAGAAGIAAIGLFLPVGRSADALGAGPAVRSLREMLK